MIEAIADRWAQSLKNAVPEHPSSTAVIKFALTILIEALLTLIVAVTVALFTGQVGNTLIVLFSFAILRAVSGGYHFKSAMTCVIATTIASNILAFSEFNPTTVLILNVISLILVAVYAPSKIEKQTRIKPKYYPMLKLISILIVCSNFIFMSPVLAAAFTLQAVSLIRKRR